MTASDETEPLSPNVRTCFLGDRRDGLRAGRLGDEAMRRALGIVVWVMVALLGTGAFAVLALHRGERLNAAWLVAAAGCTYAVGYRFYSKWIAVKLMAIDDRRATPSEIHDDGRDFVKTNRWIVFGHHFAAISGPGPLVGPVLAAQFGYLPGTLWLLIGVGAGRRGPGFHDPVCSMRRDGRSLGEMVKDEVGRSAGILALVAIVGHHGHPDRRAGRWSWSRRSQHSPWGTFTIAATMPIAMLMGVYLRFLRPGSVLEGSAIGVLLLLLAVVGRQVLPSRPRSRRLLTLAAPTLAWAIIAYGLGASILPVWLLLAPRDYLSTFMKLGTIAAAGASASSSCCRRWPCRR